MHSFASSFCNLSKLIVAEPVNLIHLHTFWSKEETTKQKSVHESHI